MSWMGHLRGAMTEVNFALQLIQRLQQAGDRRQPRFDPHNFRLTFVEAGGEVAYANLRNLYDEYLTYPSRDRERFLQFTTRSLLATHKPLPEDFADARSDIFLAVRQRGYYSLLELSMWAEADLDFSWPYQPLTEHLGVGLVYDLPEAMVMLQSSHLEDWGVTFYEAYEQGLINLTEIDATFTTIDDHSYASATGDHYDISRMLLPELIRELEVIGDPIVLLPNRDRLLITGSEDRRGLETVALLAQQLLTHPRPMTGLAFRLDHDEWRCWLPDPDHPAYALLKTLGMQSRQHDYAEQRELLQTWLSSREPHVEVSEYRMHGARAKQPPTSFCVWQEGQTLLLPKTDRVCFLRHDQSRDYPLVEGINVSWPRVQCRLAHMVREVPALYPPRYRVERFPSDPQLALLHANEPA
jgi:hypothetical protein